MAINNTNAIATKLGLELPNSYIRIYGKLKINGSYEVAFNVYKDRDSYVANSMDIINNQLEFDFSAFNTPALTGSQGYSYLHDLAVAELVARGLVQDNLSVIDVL